MRIYTYFIILLVSFGFISCEDVVDIDTQFEKPQMVVDAWVNDSPTSQIIKLTWSQNYFDSQIPEGIDGATVKVIRNSQDTLSFSSMGKGIYQWNPSGNNSIGEIGDAFELSIRYENAYISSSTTLKRTAIIDSLVVEEKMDELGYDDGSYASCYAVDIAGKGDAYWIKTFTNDTLNNKPRELVISYDGTFDPGSSYDGLPFIRPLRDAVNRLSDDAGYIPYLPGDKVRVEIHSLSDEAYAYLSIIQEQLTNGDNTIFALPFANATGNVFNTTTHERVLGFFNVASITKEEITIP
ncbi:MAG TPA: DUF4249 domain-containing protein [Saprospiraceae bacterium]|nr:DUF4249 domain-containing protein [Saprospiraceae bacterium]